MQVTLMPTTQRLGQYDYIRRCAKTTIGKTDYIIAVYGALNIGGLIGPERNGIVVLNETKSNVVLDEHMPQDSGYFGPSKAQVQEFGRILAMEPQEFVEFCNSHPRSRYKITLSGRPPKPPKPLVKLPTFVAEQFTATKFKSAALKAKFANHFAKFVARGFREEDFPEWFYRLLTDCFHHCAEYDRNGFFATWFSSPVQQMHFIDNAVDGPIYGDPAYTMSDVERVLQKWLIDSGVAEIFEQKRNAAV